MIGQAIAHYQVTGKLGEGGMGVVYRAHDTVLGRDVAIKVLPEALARDADRMARFRREAQVLASLNHPNIAAIYGVEDRALIMELVEGEDLAGPLPVDKSIAFARQISEALLAAHDKGIIHRDLKPANIKITPDGVVKVLDFGLAKAADLTESDTVSVNSPTVIAGTMAGVILGTAAYMAPEQARGQSVDKRADIWSFGVVLFEMLSGKRLFDGETVSDTLAAVMKDPIEWSLLPKETPPEVRLLLRRCLERDRKKRLRDLGDAWVEGVTAEPPRQAKGLLHMVAAVFAVGMGVTGFGWWRATRPVERPLMRLNVEVGKGTDLARSIGGSLLAVSPDGSRIAVTVRGADGSHLATRLLNQNQVTTLPGTQNAYGPFFSPDSQWIGFFADRKLKKISVQGGAAVTLCDAPVGRGASWGDDGNIIAALNTIGPLWRIPSSGGTPTAVTKLNQGERTHRHPHVLPRAKTVLFTAHTGSVSYDDANIDAVSLLDGQRKSVYRGGHSPIYLSSGHLIYTHAGTIFAAPFDAGALSLAGTSVPVMEDLGSPGNANSDYGFSTAGTFVYLGGGSGLEASLFWLDSTGVRQPLQAGTGRFAAPRFSPDGKRLSIGVSTATSEDIWVKDIERGTFSRLSFLPGMNRGYVWTPPGTHIFFSSETTNEGIYSIRSDGSGEARRLTDGKDRLRPHSFSPDGKRLIAARPGVIVSIPVEWVGDQPKLGKPEPFLEQAGQRGPVRLSPDGRWLAYSSIESGLMEVYVRPFPGPGGKWQISTGGGFNPEWSRNAQELFFMDRQGRVNVAAYTAPAGAFQPGHQRVWSERRVSLGGAPVYDIAPDGKRIAALLAPESQGERLTHLVFLLNFFDELRRRVRR